jgi:hypothetical protein
LETHPELFATAMDYEKDGYSWCEERLEDLSKPERVSQIKRDHYKRMQREKLNKINSWKDIVLDNEGEGCNTCFI